jgi:phosphoserine phosphatase
VKNLGYKVALISGGFSFFANALKEKLDLDYAFANDLKVVDGYLTGEVEGTIINAEQKALLLKVISQQEKISLEQVVAIGDGANDLPMLAVAGLGIAFHAKDIVKKEAQNHMSHGPMTSILYFLGIPGTEAAENV